MTPNLTTRYLGFELRNPLVVAACPLTAQLDTLRRLEEAGAAAVVMPSLFEEQLEDDSVTFHRFYKSGSESPLGEPLDYPELDAYNTGPRSYLGQIGDAKKALSIPVIGSLNGISRGGWVRHARRIQEAGADALELNVYFVSTEPYVTAEELEGRYLELVAAVREAISIPLAVKIGPFFSSLPNMAHRLVQAGAGGLVLFNRFLQPDIDLEALQVVPKLVLSTSDELRLPLRWIAILRAYFEISLAATTGVHTAADVLKLLLAGADVTMVASALYRHGLEHLRTLLEGVNTWLKEKDYHSVAQMKGLLSQANAPDPAAFERANYIKSIVHFDGPEAIP
jgi:dihydroorotate dehydrogenase (fumarate)